MYTGNFKGPDNMRVRIYTKNKPIAPPKMHSTVASIKNSKRMVLFFAPMAFFKPIMLVLSLTVTNIILAMPNKPTIKLIPPMIAPTTFTVEKKPVMALLKASTLFKEKLSSCLGASLLICRIIPFNSSINASVVTPSFPLAIKMGLAFSSSNSCRQNL